MAEDQRQFGEVAPGDVQIRRKRRVRSHTCLIDSGNNSAEGKTSIKLVKNKWFSKEKTQNEDCCSHIVKTHFISEICHHNSTT